MPGTKVTSQVTSPVPAMPVIWSTPCALQVEVVDGAEIVDEDRVVTLRKRRDVLAVRVLEIDHEARLSPTVPIRSAAPLYAASASTRP